MSMTPVRSPSLSIHEHKNSELAYLNGSPISSAVPTPSEAADTPISGVAISELSSPIVAAAAATTSLPSAMQIVDDAISPSEEEIVFKLNNMSFEEINDKVDADVLNGLSKAALQKLNGEVINRFSPDQMQKLNAHVLNNLSITALRNLNRGFLYHLSAPTIRGLNEQVLNNLPASRLSSVGYQSMRLLSDETISKLDIRMLASIDPMSFPFFCQDFRDNIKVDKTALNKARLKNESAEFMFDLNNGWAAKALNELSADAIEGLNENVLNWLNKDTIKELNLRFLMNLSDVTVMGLNAKVINSLSKDTIEKLNAQFINNLSPEKLNEHFLMNLSNVTIMGLSAKVINNLSDTTIEKLSAQFINSLSPTTLAQLDPRVIAKLDMGARMGLTSGTLDNLSKECLEEVITTPEFLVHALVDEDFQKLLSSVNPKMPLKCCPVQV